MDLKEFVFDRYALVHTLAVLGTLPCSSTPSEPLCVIVRFERTAMSSSFFAWFHKRDDFPDVKIYVICPVTEVHIRKYTKQGVLMVHETPALYQSIVKPYILAFDPARTQWVQDILAGTDEASNILNASPDFLIIPDMKWDTTNVSTLYLIALYTHSDIHCMRDLRRKTHLGMLKTLRRDTWRVLELDSEDGSSILERMSFTYGLGTEHGLYKPMAAALAEVDDDAD
ncbi:HIT-like domain-containing protein [Suillus lakei]|nr:HIT-like domain-containing protein [Suillus lakei]